jgi:tryptophan synthase
LSNKFMFKEWVCFMNLSASLSFIPLIGPTSSDQRIRQVASMADSFIYVVSTLGVTGSRATVDSDLPALVARIKNITQVPLAVGFGVSNREHFVHVGSIAEGVVIGSRLIKLLKSTPLESIGKAVEEFSLEITNRTRADILTTLQLLKNLEKIPLDKVDAQEFLRKVNGRFGEFGGRYAAEILVGCLDEIEQVT